MKELENLKSDPKHVAAAEQRIMKQKELLSRITISHEGHSLWAVSIHTLYAEKVELKHDVGLDGKEKPAEVKYDQNYYYTTALNEKNAIWHFARALGIKKKDFERWLKIKREVLKDKNEQANGEQSRPDPIVQERE